MKIFKKIIFFLVIYILFFTFSYLGKTNMDIFWNYGFCLNFSKGLLMYKDYYMVITPLYPMLIGSLMHIFGNSLLMFYLLNAFIMTAMFFVIRKISPKSVLVMFLFILNLSFPNYNNLCLLFALILIYLEKEKKSDYLVGLVLGLTFLTKNSVSFFLCLPTIIYLKTYKKVLRRIVGFSIPVILTSMYLYFNHILYDTIDKTILGLFSFGETNGNITIYFYLSLILICILFYRYYKEKDIMILYVIAFFGMCFPLFNAQHFIWSMVLVTLYVTSKFAFLLDEKILKYTIYTCYIIPIIGVFIFYHNVLMVHDDTIFKTKYVEKTTIDKYDELKSLLNNDFSNTIFLVEEAYLYKLMNNITINKYDMINAGNMGYNGDKLLLDKILKEEKGTKIIISSNITGQTSKIIYNGIKENLKLKKSSKNFWVYEI